MSEEVKKLADDNLPEELDEPQDQATLGQLLRAQREKMDVTWEDVYQDTRIPIGHLEAIESDNFESMPSEGILKGFVRNYSKFLKLDPDQMIAKLTESDPHMQELVPVSFAGSIKRGFFRDMQGSAIIVGLAVFALVVLITAVAIWWFGTNMGERTNDSVSTQNGETEQNESASMENGNPEDSTGTQEQSPVSPQSSVPDDDSIDDSSSQESTASSNGGPEAVQQEGSEGPRDPTELFGDTDSGTSSTLPFTDGEVGPLQDAEYDGSESANTLNPTQDGETQAEDESHDLEFSFDDITWVQVTDGSGNELVNGVQEADSELTLDGEAPFEIRLGNASAVKLLYRGEEVALGQYTGRNNTAEFTLQP